MTPKPKPNAGSAIFQRIKEWWWARQRQVDMEILWPICVAQAKDLDHAKMAFAVHAFNTPCWKSMGETGLYKFIDGLNP